MSSGVHHRLEGMPQVILDITMSLDGFVAGRDADLENPLGAGGEDLHEWIVGLSSWREVHGKEGGEVNADDQIVRERIERTGAVIMGRRMFSGGSGPWEDDPNAGGWWGDDPPFGVPVFILTSHAREPFELGDTTMTFVTGGIESALDQARAAAGERDVIVAGGANVAQQYLAAGLLDRMDIHIAPLLLGAGVPLFGDAAPEALELASVVHSPKVTHTSYRTVGSV
jgi:dihydrofolate reductase